MSGLAILAGLAVLPEQQQQDEIWIGEGYLTPFPLMLQSVVGLRGEPGASFCVLSPGHDTPSTMLDFPGSLARPCSILKVTYFLEGTCAARFRPKGYHCRTSKHKSVQPFFRSQAKFAVHVSRMRFFIKHCFPTEKQMLGARLWQQS